MLEQITPIILTYNEAPNIRRTLDALRWAKDIVIVDTYSEDRTLTIAAEYPQVRVYQRRFDTHQNQWNYGLQQTSITSEWIIALDADYVLTHEVIEEIRRLRPDSSVSGYRAPFVYCVYGRPLRGSAYPPVIVLYRRRLAAYRQDGHTQRVVVNGAIADLRSPILHDDRKPLRHWLISQDRYMRLEIAHLQASENERLGVPDRLRRLRVVFPFVIFFHCLFLKGGIRDGWAGVYYAFQRMLAEILLSLYLIERDFKDDRQAAWTPEREARRDNL